MLSETKKKMLLVIIIEVEVLHPVIASDGRSEAIFELFTCRFLRVYFENWLRVTGKHVLMLTGAVSERITG